MEAVQALQLLVAERQWGVNSSDQTIPVYSYLGFSDLANLLRPLSISGFPENPRLGLYYAPRMDNQMETNMENDMEAGGNIGI